MSIPSTLLDQLFIRKVSAFVGNSLLIYDYLLTFALEVAHIWNAPWTLVKAIFLVHRYANLVGQTFIMLEETGYLSHDSQKFCAAFYLYATLFSIVSGESIRFLVVMRACAILRLRRTIAILLYGSYILFAMVVLALIVGFSMVSNAAEFEYLSEIGVCFKQVPPRTWVFWLMPLSLDGLVFLTISCSLYRQVRGSRDLHQLRLIRLLARDAVLFYLAALFNILLGIVCWFVYSQDPRNMIQVLITCPVLSVTGQRVILNLRRFQAHPNSTRDLSREVDRQIAALESGHGGSTWEGSTSRVLTDADYDVDRLGHELTVLQRPQPPSGGT